MATIKFEEALALFVPEGSYGVARWSRQYTLEECREMEERLRALVKDMVKTIEGIRPSTTFPEPFKAATELIIRAEALLADTAQEGDK